MDNFLIEKLEAEKINVSYPNNWNPAIDRCIAIVRQHESGHDVLHVHDSKELDNKLNISCQPEDVVERIARAIHDNDPEHGAYCWMKYGKTHYIPMAKAAIAAMGGGAVDSHSSGHSAADNSDNVTPSSTSTLNQYPGFDSLTEREKNIYHIAYERGIEDAPDTTIMKLRQSGLPSTEANPAQLPKSGVIGSGSALNGCREAFEKWFCDGNPDNAQNLSFKQNKYCDDNIEFAWKAWQEASSVKRCEITVVDERYPEAHDIEGRSELECKYNELRRYRRESLYRCEQRLKHLQNLRDAAIKREVQGEIPENNEDVIPEKFIETEELYSAKSERERGDYWKGKYFDLEKKTRQKREIRSREADEVAHQLREAISLLYCAWGLTKSSKDNPILKEMEDALEAYQTSIEDGGGHG